MKLDAATMMIPSATTTALRTCMNHSAPDDVPHRVFAGRADAGVRLDKFLAQAIPCLSRARIKALIGAGRLATAGVMIADPNYRVKSGQVFVLTVPPPVSANPRGQAIPLHVVYEDDTVIVIDKPAGLVVHPAPGHADSTLVNALIAHCGNSLTGIGGECRPGIVHRLDKDTSGLMVAAKTAAAHAALTAQFVSRSMSRTYTAMVWGVPNPARGSCRGNIGRDPRNRKKMAVVEAGGRPARTDYELRETFGAAASLIRCRLGTGRTHQIRVHFSAMGHPIIGDPLYRGDRRGRRLAQPTAEAVAGIRRQALHAESLTFRHPVTAKYVKYVANLPDDITFCQLPYVVLHVSAKVEIGQ